MDQVPAIGRFVDYTLSPSDVERINEIRRRYTDRGLVLGNQADVGQVYPLLITRVWGDTPLSAVNGQVFLDGFDVLWVTSRSVGPGAGFFTWPDP